MDLFSLFLIFLIFILVPGIVATVFWIWMLIDVLKRKFKDPIDKVVWVIVVIFAHIFGALIYYFNSVPLYSFGVVP